jgi:hypothetical protein
VSATLEASRITEAHRLAQARLGVATVADLLATWSLIDPKRLDETTPNWLLVSTRVIQQRRTESARLAADFLNVSRLLAVGEMFAPVVMSAVDVTALTTSLTVTGPVALKQAMTLARPLAAAAETAQATSAASGMRHALAGGRETIAETTKADPAARGYRRVTSGSACKFCSNLADRGAVYDEATRHFAAHDSCSCSSQPLYIDGWGDTQRVAQFMRRDLTDAQRADANARVRAWVGSS